MNEFSSVPACHDDAANNDVLGNEALGNPAGDIHPFRMTTTGRRVALMLGMAALATATACEWTTVSAPGFTA